ncbi:hypothetical protein L0156_28985 [bacterium]|nr:hypothetical protein [bacterium]
MEFSLCANIFSHGCIRVERAVDLANWILEEEGWSDEKLAVRIKSNKTQMTRLKKPLPIYIVCFTTWVEADGSLQFRNDVYGKDSELIRSLE